MPVGAIATGSDSFSPSRVVATEICETSTSTRWRKLDGVEVGAVGAQRQLVIGAALGIVEQRARQAPPRDLAQVLDIGDGGHADDAHVTPFLTLNWPVLRNRQR